MKDSAPSIQGPAIFLAQFVRDHAPFNCRTFRRLVNDGDFNIDIPVGQLKSDRPNQLTITRRAPR